MKTLVVSHGESGAFHLAYWLKHNLKQNECDFLLSHQAAMIFRRQLPAIRPLNPNTFNMASLDSRYSRVIGSTSHSNFEKRVLARAITAQVHTEVFLDQWSGYQERLTLAGKLLVPDALLVCDDEAERRAKAIKFSLSDKIVNVERVHNYYIESTVLEIKDLTRCFYRKDGAKNVLYISEPTISPEHDSVYLLKNTLRFFLSRRRQYNENTVVRIRLIDTNLRSQHLDVIADFEKHMDVALSEASSLAEDCAWSDRIIGCCDNALVIALEAGKPVYSVLPPACQDLALPFAGIKPLFPAIAPKTAAKRAPRIIG